MDRALRLRGPWDRKPSPGTVASSCRGKGGPYSRHPWRSPVSRHDCKEPGFVQIDSRPNCKEDAERLRTWIYREVFPSIRRYGYDASPAQDRPQIDEMKAAPRASSGTKLRSGDKRRSSSRPSGTAPPMPMRPGWFNRLDRGRRTTRPPCYHRRWNSATSAAARLGQGFTSASAGVQAAFTVAFVRRLGELLGTPSRQGRPRPGKQIDLTAPCPYFVHVHAAGGHSRCRAERSAARFTPLGEASSEALARLSASIPG